MCGLVGVAGDIGFSEKKAFKDMLLFDVVRGPHSTGVAAVANKTNNIHTYKAVGHPYNLFKINTFSPDGKGIYDGDPKMLMGHNRFATVGEVTPSNAHPFKHGDIVGAHNGTLTPYHLDKLEEADTFEVDSEAIFYTIHKVGHEEMLKRIHGAYALTWYDKASETLHFIRNVERPLYYAWTKDHKTLFWASEPWMMDIACGRNGVKLEENHLFFVDKLYTLNLKEKNLVKEELVESKEFHKGFTYQYQNNGNNWKNTGTSIPKIGGNVGTNVFKNSNENVTSLMDKAFLNNLVGKHIEFYIGKPQKSEEGIDYFLCHFTNPKIHYYIRLYAGGHPRQKEWLEAQGDYLAKVKKISYDSKNNPYVLLDMRSIGNETKPPPWKNILGKEPVTKGFNDEVLTADQYDKRVSNGCAYCSSDIYWADRDKVKWFDKDTVLGVCCTNDPDRVENMNELFGKKS